MRDLIVFIKDPREITQGIVRTFFSNVIKDDRVYLSLLYAASFWKRMSWDNPQTFNEKMTWLKLYNRCPIFSIMVDKYDVKKYIADKIGENYVVENYAVANKWDEIDWESLPNQFVVKCTGGGGTFICRDKATFDYKKCRSKLEPKLKQRLFNEAREWPYKNMPQRIIVDKLLDDHTGKVLRDYKWWCFNGEPTFMYITVKTDDIYENFYDMDFRPVMINHGFPRYQPEFERPECFDEMRVLAKKLANDIPFVRIDFFQVDGMVYFGEFTFFDWGGHRPFRDDWDKKIGDMIDLSKIEFRK